MKDERRKTKDEVKARSSAVVRPSSAFPGPLLAKGATAEVFAWGDRHVLKLFFAGRLLRQARYEAQVGALIHAAGIPSPAVVALTELSGRGGVIYDRVVGPSMDKALEREPWRVVTLARRFAAAHAALHRTSVGGLPTHRERLAQRIRAADPLPDRARERALAVLARLPDGGALCHGDFHPGNLLLSPRGPVMIDWENATLGDPQADVARTLLMRYAHLRQPAGASRLALGAGVGLFSAVYLPRYCQLTGALPVVIAAWQLPVAAARLSENLPVDEEAALLGLVQRLAR